MKKFLLYLVGAALLLGAGAAAALYFIPAVQDRVVRAMVDSNMSQDRSALMADDALRVAVCGSGSPMADPDRAPACNLVFAGGEIFVVDIGPGSWSRASRWQIPAGQVSAVLLTHFHSDHIGDMGEVNLQSWVSGRPKPLAVYGGPGVERVVAGYNEAFAMDRTHRIAHHGADFLVPELGILEAHPIAGVTHGSGSVVVLERNGLKITAFSVDHQPIEPAFGYRFDYKGRSVVFSGDTHKSADLAIAAKGADVLIHEAMAKDAVNVMEASAKSHGRKRIEKILYDILDYHASPRDAAETAAAAGVPTLVLSHLIPPVPGWFAEILFRRGTAIDGVETHIAHDGMLIELPAGSKAVNFSDLGH
jgi:ribonuclease Z